jgi:3-isopropylmalate/(R)-2-methylmalate dehydratase small subunit
MQPFRKLTSKALPLDRANVDTDQIIPKQFLKRIERTGYEDFLFFDWRKAADFELNDPRYKGAQVLVAGKNFGCGSSREHAAWALHDYGFRCVIASSYADIFHSNAGKNGILLITLPEEQVAAIMARAKASDPEHGNIYELTVSLEENTLQDNAGFSTSFTIDPFRRYCLLEGLDDIGLTLRHESELERFEKKHDAAFWEHPKPEENAVSLK